MRMGQRGTRAPAVVVGLRQSSSCRRSRRAVLLAALTIASATVLSGVPARAVPSPAGSAGTIQTMAGVTRNFQQGGYGPEGVLARESQFQNPRGLAFAPNGDLYVADALNNRVRKIDANGVVSLVAGNGTLCTTDAAAPCYTGDGGAAVNATLNEPHGVAVDSEGNVYIADSKNCVIRKVDTGGIISTYAGTGQRNPANPNACAKTDIVNAPVLTVALDQPKSLFMTRQGGNDTLYIADFGNNQIRMIDVDSPTPQNIRVAGSNRSRYYSAGVNNDALDADLRHPEAVWVDGAGTIYISDGGNNLIRKIVNGKISTIAGDVAAAQANATTSSDLVGDSDGDGGQAINAHLDKPRGITGFAGKLYVAEEHGSRIRRINLNTGGIDTVAGDGTILEQRTNGGSLFIKGDPDGNALEAQFAMLHDIQLAPDGSLWIADSRHNRVRAMPDLANAPGAVIATGGGVATAVRPGAPASVTAWAGNRSATVTWAAPADTGGSPITSYTVTSSAGQTANVNGTTLTATVTGLSNGTSYTFTVQAGNSVGKGAASAPSNAVVPTSTPATPPGAPTVGTATGLVSTNRAVGVAAVSWSAPSTDGGSPISNYVITASPGGQTTIVSAPSTSTMVSNLQNGTTYTFTVQAQNSVGLSPPSAPTGPAAPYSYPAPVPSVTATVSDTTAVVGWEAPADDGGRPITGYQISAEPLARSAGAAGRSAATTALTVTVGAGQRSATLTGLSPGTRYTFSVVANNEAGASQVGPSSAATATFAAGRSGYWMVGSDGTVYPFGDAKSYGNAPTASAVDLEPTPSGNGYWIVDDIGRVFAFGDALARGDVNRAKLAAGEKATSLAATNDGGGYWIFTNRGRVLTFGSAAFLGDVSNLTLAGPVLDSIVTPSGAGYYMVASDGGIFAFGDATFYGSMGGQKLNAPVQSLVPDADGAGYWLVASDGGIFAFQAGFKGSMGATKLNRPVTGMVRAGSGYLMVGEDGGIFDFSGSPDGFKGSLGANPPARPITSVAVLEK